LVEFGGIVGLEQLLDRFHNFVVKPLVGFAQKGNLVSRPVSISSRQLYIYIAS
jgi:hypothetical protein